MATGRRNRRLSPQKFLSSLTGKLGSSVFSIGFGGFVNQYLQQSHDGMLIFGLVFLVGVITLAATIVAER